MLAALWAALVAGT